MMGQSVVATFILRTKLKIIRISNIFASRWFLVDSRLHLLANKGNFQRYSEELKKSNMRYEREKKMHSKKVNQTLEEMKN